MKHLQELEVGLKIVDFSHNHDCGGKSDWTRVSEVSRGTGEPVHEGRGKGEGESVCRGRW